MGKKKKSYRIVEGSSKPCPRCGQMAEVREHKEITQKLLSQPFYFSRWFNCKNTACNTNIFTHEKDKVFPAKDDASYGRRLIQAQLDYAMTGMVEDEYAESIECKKKETPPWE